MLSTKLTTPEASAANVFTKDSFLRFRDEMKNAELYFVFELVNEGTSRVLYKLSKFRHPSSKWEVVYCPEMQALKCSCMMFESVAIPCAHMVVATKVEHLEEIPSSCILKRWTKVAKCHLQSAEVENYMTRIVRYRSLASMCNKLAYYGSHTYTNFMRAKSEIGRLTMMMEENANIDKKGKNIATDDGVTSSIIRYPHIVKTKGNPRKDESKIKKRRRCSRCKRVGQTIRKCPQSSSNHNGHEGPMVSKVRITRFLC